MLFKQKLEETKNKSNSIIILAKLTCLTQMLGNTLGGYLVTNIFKLRKGKHSVLTNKNIIKWSWYEMGNADNTINNQ